MPLLEQLDTGDNFQMHCGCWLRYMVNGDGCVLCRFSKKCNREGYPQVFEPEEDLSDCCYFFELERKEDVVEISEREDVRYDALASALINDEGRHDPPVQKSRKSRRRARRRTRAA